MLAFSDLHLKLAKERHYWKHEPKSEFTRGVIHGLWIAEAEAQSLSTAHDDPVNFPKYTTDLIYRTLRGALRLLKGGNRAEAVSRLETALDKVNASKGASC